MSTLLVRIAIGMIGAMFVAVILLGIGALELRQLIGGGASARRGS